MCFFIFRTAGESRSRKYRRLTRYFSGNVSLAVDSDLMNYKQGFLHLNMFQHCPNDVAVKYHTAKKPNEDFFLK